FRRTHPPGRGQRAEEDEGAVRRLTPHLQEPPWRRTISRYSGPGNGAASFWASSFWSRLSRPQDDPRRPLVAPVGPGPVEHHHQPVAETDQEEDVRREPEPPGQRAGQPQLAQVHDRGHAADGGEVAVVAIAERCRRLSGEARADRRGDVSTHLLRRRCHPGHRFSILLNGGEVTGNEHVRLPRYRKVRFHRHATGG